LSRPEASRRSSARAAPAQASPRDLRSGIAHRAAPGDLDATATVSLYVRAVSPSERGYERSLSLFFAPRPNGNILELTRGKSAAFPAPKSKSAPPLLAVCSND